MGADLTYLTSVDAILGKILAMECPSVCNDGVVVIGWARWRMWGAMVSAAPKI
jgi:hypothetical protein